MNPTVSKLERASEKHLHQPFRLTASETKPGRAGICLRSPRELVAGLGTESRHPDSRQRWSTEIVLGAEHLAGTLSLSFLSCEKRARWLEIRVE